MKYCFIMLQLLMAVAVVCCTKKDHTPANPVARIDVNDVYKTDPNGNLLYANFADSQWQSKTLSAEELSLFSALDTADLTGTSTPDSVNQYSQNPVQYRYMCYAYPNPFSTSFHLSPYFNENFEGTVVFKYVVADSLLQVVAKGAALLQAYSANHSSRTGVALSPGIPAGHFRLYYTLSSKAHEHFYQSWGNIEKLD